MDCIENRLKNCNKKVADNFASDYRNPDTMKYYDFTDGVNTSFNMDDDFNFRNFYIGSKSPAKIRKEKEKFLEKLGSLNVEDILGKNWALRQGSNGWVKVEQRRNPDTKFITCFISLEVPQSYEEAYQIGKMEEANGLQDIFNNLGTDKKSLEEIEKLRKLKVQKYLDEHPHLNRVFININGKKVLYTRTSNGIVRGGDQLKLNFDAPVGEENADYSKKLDINSEFSEEQNSISNIPTEDSEMLSSEMDLPPITEGLPAVYDNYGLDNYELTPEIPDVQPFEEPDLMQPFENYQDPRTDIREDIPDIEEEPDLAMPFEDYLAEKGITIKPEDQLSNREYSKFLEGLINEIIKSKKTRIVKLSERISSLKKLGKSTQQRIQYQREIKKLQEDIDELVKRRSRYITKTVEQTIKDEISELEKVITPRKDSDGNVVLDNNGDPIYDIPIDRDLIAIEQFENRLNNVCIFLTGCDINGTRITGDILTGIPFDEQIKFDKELSFYIAKISNIAREYDKRRAELILDYAKSDIARKHFKSEQERKQFEKVALDFLQHPEKTIDEIFSGVAPTVLLQIADAEQGLGIFGAILKTYFYEEQRGFERQVKILFDEVKQLEKNIKSKIKDFNTNIFFKIDELGNRTNRLITLFKDNWKNFYYSLSSDQNKYHYQVQTNYSNKKKQETFYNFKKNIVENAEIFQLQEYEEIWNILKEYDKANDTDFSTILAPFKPKDFSQKTSYTTYTKYNKQDSKHFQREIINRAKQQLITYLDNLVIEGNEKNSKFILEDGRNPFVFAKDFTATHNYNKNITQAWSVDYVMLVPKKEQYYDEHFSKNIASNNDIQDLWDKYEELLIDNINAALIESGAKIASDEIPIDLEITKSEFFKTQTFFKRLAIRWENSHWWAERFYTGNYLRDDSDSNRITEIKSFLLSGNSFLRKLKTYLKTYDRTQLELLLNERGIKYKSWDDYLKEFNFQEDSVNSKNKEYYRRLQQIYIGYLASLIASQDVLNRANLDFSDNIGKLAQGVIMMQARKKTQVFADAIINFLKNNIRKTNDNNNKRDEYYSHIMDIWSQRNIYGNTKANTRSPWSIKKGRHAKGININTTQNQISDQYKNIQTLPQSFTSDKTKYDISITLKNENNEPVKESEKLKLLFQTNINQRLATEDVKEIEVGGKTYYVNVTYFKKGKTKIITREEYLNSYKNKLQQDAENEKVYMTVKSFIDGSMSLIAGKSLMLNPESGIKNRFEGEFTNIRLAVQGLFDYGIRELYAAKRFLNMAILAKSSAKGIAMIAPDHYKQLRIYELFTQQMSLYQDHTNLDLADNEKYSLTAWSITYPETQNQGENILSTLIYNQIKVKDINGKEHLLFDENAGKYGKFTIFDENEAVKNNRLKLKSEFDTDENRALWENWITYKDNNRSLQLIHDCAINVTRAQGNYEQGDVNALQSNTLGRPSWQFKRWAFSHLKQRYNDTTIDYRAGKLNQKGMFNILMEHPGAMLPFILMDTAITLGNSPKQLIKNFRFTNLSQIILNSIELLLQLGFPIWLAVKMCQQQSKIGWYQLSLKQEINLGFDMIFGSLARSITTAANQASLKIDQYSPLQTNKYVVEGTEKIYDKVYQRSKIDREERRAIFGAIQTTANNIYLYGLFFGINALLNMLLEQFTKCQDGDKDCEEEKKNTIKRTEKSMFFLINLWHNLVEDNKKWWNPFSFKDNMGNVSTLESAKRLTKIWYKLQSEEADLGDRLTFFGKNIPQPFLPNQVVNPLVYGIAAGLSAIGLADETYKENYFNLVEFPFQDKFVYDNKAIDILLKSKQTKVKTNYDAYKSAIDLLAKEYIKDLKKADVANGIEDKDYDKDLKWFKKEFKTKIFGANSQNEVMINLMDDKEYNDLLDINYYKAMYYTKNKKYPSEDEVDKEFKKK